jgi:hypothetical protein
LQYGGAGFELFSISIKLSRHLIKRFGEQRQLLISDSVNPMRKVAPRHFFRGAHERADGCGKSSGEVNRHPRRRKQQQQGHQTQGRYAQQTDLALALKQVLVLPLRPRDRVVHISVIESLRHEDETKARCQRNRSQVKPFAIRQSGICPELLQTMVAIEHTFQLLLLRGRHDSFTVRDYLTTVGDNFYRRQFSRGRQLVQNILPFRLRATFDFGSQQRRSLAQLFVLKRQALTLLLTNTFYDVFGQTAHPLLNRSVEKQIRERGHRRDRQQAQANEVDEQPGLNS